MFRVKDKMPVKDSTGDDQQLIHLVISHGDVHAYRTLYDKYAPVVLGFTYRMVRNRGLAEELTQETFWRVWQNASGYQKSRGSFVNWMYGIARNLAIDAIRRQKKIHFQALSDSFDAEEDGPSAYVAADDHDVFEETWIRDRREHIARALSQLPENQRNIVVWTFFEGKTRREIAAEYDIPLGTVNTRARLALQKLQDILSIEGFEE
ncbi:MAG: sigma-70 family RNA polymerase sigma factor [Ardenticatenaceae bacterium]|nr:sigma-70 family RNA polymerase sigma factor [Ardenticatenaceae bacterium]